MAPQICSAVTPHIDSTGKTLTLMLLNKTPGAIVTAQFAMNGFKPSEVTTYTLSKKKPKTIVASGTQPWSSSLALSAVLGNIVGGDRIDAAIANRGVGPQSRRDHGPGERNGRAFAENCFRFWDRDSRRSAIRRRNHSGSDTRHHNPEPEWSDHGDGGK